MNALLEQEEEIRGLDALPPDALYEVIDGEAKEVPHMGFAANQVAFRMAMKFSEVVRDPRDIVVMESLFELPIPSKRRRRPDVAYVPAARVPADWPPPRDQDPPALKAAPAIVVEVISPTDLIFDLEERRQEYFAAGVATLIVVYPRFGTVHVFDAIDRCRILSSTDLLDVSNILPGFTVRVADLFAPLNPLS